MYQILRYMVTHQAQGADRAQPKATRALIDLAQPRGDDITGEQLRLVLG